MQKLIAEEQNSRNRISRQFMAVLLVAVVLLSIARVFFANWLIESSETLANLDQKIAQLDLENQTLGVALRGKESLSTIESQANYLGFTKQVKLTFILPEPHVAFKF